ncbi:PREDICTED: nucleoporin GLE1 isoform X2 [Lupinus angustifolius]|uniref:nucleoporin GLE1 isoform X2 n=1 Tax=Lupinus angustifolius TaxID=3871 RepID=UPI00092E3735|nr:PREDICTED: nucleoporin GLE1 isoform X2 [Lupinus angustifolius]
MQAEKNKKEKSSIDKKRMKKNKNLVRRRRVKDEVDLEQKTVRDTDTDIGAAGKKKKAKSSVNRKRKNRDIGKQKAKDEIDLEEKSDVVLENCPSETHDDIQEIKDHENADTEAAIKPCKSKKSKKKRTKEESFVEEAQNLLEKAGEPDNDHDQENIYIISSGDDDGSKGMRKWISEYHQSRPGLNVLQQQIDDFITDHEEKLEEERKEREARAADGGWTVVVHHKGRKKTTDAESGVAVGSVAQAAVEHKMTKKKHNEVGLDFYRFQKREAQRNEIMMLQSKFEEDKKRLQQLRAARKFRPY